MARLKLFHTLFALAFLLVHQADVWGCSDPEQHKIHLRQEMEARLRSQTGSGATPPAASPAPSALDSAESFFKAPAAAQSTQGERSRRR